MNILKETRRILSLVLAICLLAGVLPSLALADSTWKNRETPYGAKLKAETVLYADEEMEREAWILKEDALVRVTETRPKSAKVEFTVKKQPKSAWVDGELLQPVDLATPTDLDAVIVSQDVILSNVEESHEEQVPTVNQPEESPIEAKPGQGDPSTRPDGLGQDDNLSGSEPAEPEEVNTAVILSEVEKSPSEAEPEQGDLSTTLRSGRDDKEEGSEPAEPEETNNAVILSEVEESPSEQVPTDNQPEEAAIVVEDPEPETIEEPETLGSLQEELPETEVLPTDVRAVPEEIDESSETSPATVYALAGDGTMAASSYINPNLPASRAQSPYGTCWSFSTIGGLELDLIRDKAADTSIDLSEFFLIYYSGFTYANPKGGKDEIYSDLGAILQAGGNVGHAAYYLSVLIGTTTEADNPYTDAENRIPSNIRNIAAQITGAYDLDTHDRDLIKNMILAHGGVSASINANDDVLVQNARGDWTLYNTDTYTNHAILLVGWDDNYAASNFRTPPPGPGAWYARNSWGDYKSYFWISYYDEGLLSRGGMAYDAQNTGMDNFVYTYAADAAQRSISGGKDRAVAVQEYTVDAQEQITAVGVDVETPGITISARVLVNGKEAGATKTRKAAQKGIYRLPLVSPVLMTSREIVAVEVTYTGNGKDTIWIPYQTTGVDTRKNDKDQTITIRIHRADGGGFTLNDNHYDEDSTIRLYTKQKSSAGLVQSITLNKTSLSLKTGEYANLKATIAPSDATNKTLTWTSSSPEIAYMDGNGRVVGGTKPGTTLITAMSSNGVYASCKVTVTWQEVAPRALYISSDLFDAGTKSYTIPVTKGLRKGTKLILKATSEPAYTSDFYTWTTSNLDVIGIGTVTRNECEVILNGSGKVRITLSADNHPEISTYVDLNVNLYVPATWMQISAGTLKLLAGDTYQITAKLLPEDATDKTVTWTSSDPKVAKVDKTGLVTAVKGGTATITASAEGGSLTLTCDVTVIPRAESVTLDTKTKTLNEGDSFVLNATVNPSDAWDQRITWSSSDRNIATVNSSGRVTGVKDGTAVITVTTVDGGLTDTCTVTVKTTDPIKAFVYRMYRICLLREPDEGGFNGWVSALRKGTATGSQLAYGFLNSDEVIGRRLSDGDFVERNYEAIMGRASDAGGKQGWKDALAAGMSRKFVISGFVKSAEFANICKSYGIVKGDYTSDEARDVNAGVTGFVSRLYTKMLGRAYDPDGLNAWSAAILKAPTAATVLQVSLNGFMHSPEFVNKNLNDTELVKVLYRTFLDREADQGGLSAWVQALQQGNDRDTVAAGFANSPEFAAIMAKYGF